MIRHLFGASAGGAIIVLAAAAWLQAMPVKAGECGLASWYGSESGNRTANGEHFDGNSLTAAHRTLPFNTRLKVTFQGRSVVVRVNDRGPYISGRSLDLSRAAAQRLGILRRGTAKVCWQRVR